MKIGVIGVGYWGKKHVEEYKALGINDLIVADLKEENLLFCEEKYKTQVTKDYRKILKDPEVIAVSICTPNETHYRLTQEALYYDKHVLVEKPMTLRYSHALDLVELAKERNKVLVVGHIYRFNNALKKVKSMLKEKELGKDIYTIKLTWTNLEPVWNRDILFDLAPHPIDIIDYLFEENLDQIRCVGASYRKPEGEEVAYLTGKIGKTIVALEMSWLLPKKRRELEIVGSEKTVFVDCLAQDVTTYDYLKGTTEKIPVVRNNTLRDELKFFIKCVNENNRNAINSAEVGAKVVKILEIAQKSMRVRKLRKKE
ncbi:MAG: Gfo/Idh/MocA family oxidoreductase [Candidatus Aenigmatarchaeota archaeon]